MRHTRLAALSPTQDGQAKKLSQNDLKEKELNQIYRQAIPNQVKPATSQHSSYQSGQYQNGQLANGLLTQSSQQKLLMQQPQSAQAIRNYSVKNSNSQVDMKMSASQVKQLGQENLLGAISINNNVMTASQQMQGSQAAKNGKMQKSQSLQKNMRGKQQTGSLKSLKHLQILSNNNAKDNNENAENENGIEKQIQYLGSSNANILNIQFNPTTTLNRLSDLDIDMKKSLANIRLPKLPAAPLSGKAKEKNQKNQQKLNNFVDTHMENNQEEDKGANSKKNEKDPDLERIKDRFKTNKQQKDTPNFFEQKAETLSSENQTANNAGSNISVTPQNQTLGSRQTETSKKDDELNKIYGGGSVKSLRSNTPKQNGAVFGLKPNLSSASLQITPQTTSASIQQSFGMTAFSTKLGPKKNSIQSLQQKQLRLLDRQAYQNTTGNNHNNNNTSNNNSQVKEEGEDGSKQNAKHNGPLYISHYAHRSKAGCNYQGPKKNQDNFIIHPNLNKMPNRYLFCVCDGHGVNGHDVSGFIRNTFPSNKINREFYQQNIRSSFRKGFDVFGLGRLLESRIDCTFSGSTFVAVLIIDDKIWCANTGDSRAIMCKQSKALWNAEPLSNDHKADDPEEKKRIEASGGRVDSYRDYNGDPVGPARVWMKYDDIPGLAMSRSFGDLIAAQCGVICEPDIKFFNVEDDDRFIVVASDGVWEFLNNRQVMVHVMPYYIRQQPDMACQKLVKEATSHWKQHDEVVDDITAICVFLHKNKPKLPNQNKESESDQNDNHINTIHQDDHEEDESTVAPEKLNEEVEKPADRIDEDLIEAAGSKQQKNVNQQQKQQHSVSPYNQVTINMKLRKEQGLNKQKSSEANKNPSKSSAQMQKYEQEEKEVEEIIEKEFNNLNELISGKGKERKSTTPTSLPLKNVKIENNKSKVQNNNNKSQPAESYKRTEESSKNLIPDVDDSDDSEYSKDFELDRERAEKETKNAKQMKEKEKQLKKKEKSPHKSAEIQQYNFEVDDEDDDAFFKHL